MKTVLACILIVALVHATPEDDFVSEAPPTSFKHFTTAADNMDLHNEAAAHVTDLLQSGKTASACASLADSSIDEINASVGAAQKALDAVPKGASCANENKAQVDAAAKAAKKAADAEAAAKTAADKAKKAPVTFKSATVMDIESGSCTAFYADTNYKAAKTAAEAASKTHNQKKGEKTAADKALKSAQDAQKAAIQACACKVQNKHKTAAKAASAANSAENKKAWDKAHMMKCVLAGTSAGACKVPTCPTVKVPALQEPAKSAKCSATYNYCATENSQGKTKCLCPKGHTVVYGQKHTGKSSGTKMTGSDVVKTGKYKTKVVGSSGQVTCSNGNFGDPIRGYQKACFCSD